MIIESMAQEGKIWMLFIQQGRFMWVTDSNAAILQAFDVVGRRLVLRRIERIDHFAFLIKISVDFLTIFDVIRSNTASHHQITAGGPLALSQQQFTLIYASKITLTGQQISLLLGDGAVLRQNVQHKFDWINGHECDLFNLAL
nr:hypothetical protein [Marinicella sp. NBU2979]